MNRNKEKEQIEVRQKVAHEAIELLPWDNFKKECYHRLIDEVVEEFKMGIAYKEYDFSAMVDVLSRKLLRISSDAAKNSRHICTFSLSSSHDPTPEDKGRN